MCNKKGELLSLFSSSFLLRGSFYAVSVGGYHPPPPPKKPDSFVRPNFTGDLSRGEGGKKGF